MDNKNTLTLLKNEEFQDNSYIVFYLNSNKYAIDIKNILEVINIPLISMPVSAPKGIIGMFDYNGMMIKVIDICPLIGKQAKKFSVNNQLIIAVINGNCFAVHTEYIENIIRIKHEELQPFPFDMENQFINGIYKKEDSVVNIIDIASLDKVVDTNKSEKSEIDYADLMPDDEKSLETLKLRTNQLKKMMKHFLSLST